MAKLSDEKRAALLKLLEEDENTPESEVMETGPEDAEEVIIFRGSADAFMKAFGVRPAENTPEDDQKADGSADSEETEARKEEPKPKPRSKYFG